MPIPILMPALSPTMEEGTLAAWHVKEGDTVSSGDIVAEIETDKATMEVEAVDEGIVGKLLLPAGSEGVLVNTPIALLLEDGESASDIDIPAAPSTPAPVVASEEVPAAEARVDETKPSVQKMKTKTPANEMPPPGAPASPMTSLQRASVKDGIKASPLARRLASQNGLDLGVLSGTGPHGRVVKRDIEAALERGAGQAHGGMTGAAAVAAGLDANLYPPDSYTTVKNDGMRKIIASRLSQSFNEDVPHFPLVIECEIDTLLAARARMNALSPKDEDGAYKVSVNDFILKASAMALMKVPAANASYTHEAIARHHHADIGVAVAIEGGLITPIIRQAESKGLVEISRSVKEMAARARQRRLKPEEYQGGTFSVSNLGMYGIKSFASIINQPQGCIMSVGAGEPRAIVKDGALAVATMMTITLTCDHRVVDGAVGAQFLGAFKQFIEEPASMLL